MSFKAFAVLSVVIALLAGALKYMDQQNGKLKAVNVQYLTTINAQSEAMNDLAMKHFETNQMLADSRKFTSVLNRKAEGLADDLRNQNDDCINRPWPESVIERVRQFRNDSH